MSTQLVKYSVSQIADKRVQDILKDLAQTLNDLPIIKESEAIADVLASNFVFLSGSIAQNTTGVKLKHGLGYVPLDLILTSAIGSDSGAFQITWRYEDFDTQFLVANTTGTSGQTVNVRLLLGAHP